MAAVYATIEDLVQRFGETQLIQLTDRSTPPADAIGTAVAQQALDDAANLIDGYVAAKYALPLATVPPLLNQLACDLARFNLYTDQAPDQVATRNTAAIATLRRISEGAVKIDAAGVEPESRSDMVETAGPERTFSRCSLRSF